MRLGKAAQEKREVAGGGGPGTGWVLASHGTTAGTQTGLQPRDRKMSPGTGTQAELWKPRAGSKLVTAAKAATPAAGGNDQPTDADPASPGHRATCARPGQGVLVVDAGTGSRKLRPVTSCGEGRLVVSHILFIL